MCVCLSNSSQMSLKIQSPGYEGRFALEKQGFGENRAIPLPGFRPVAQAPFRHENKGLGEHRAIAIAR